MYDDLLDFLGNIPTYAIAIESVNEAIKTHEREQGQKNINAWKANVKHFNWGTYAASKPTMTDTAPAPNFDAEAMKQEW